MGNVPAKEDRRNSTTSTTTSTSRRRTGSLASTLQQVSPFNIKNAVAASTLSSSSARKQKEKERYKELHAQGLVVKYDENVDGGYLAPYGTYNLNLDYTISIVKSAIIDRKLAPFYTPLQDHNDNWTDTELLEVVDNLRLHALPHEAEDGEDEDLAYDADSVDTSTLSKKELRRHNNKVFMKKLKLKKLRWQEEQEERYQREKATSRQAASRSLKLKLYRNVIECPICFLYYPKWINYTRCCAQPICTECFVQIKRLEPHYPHDTEEEIQNGAKNDPNLLISEPACCPYCALPNFGVTYQAPTSFRTGLNGISPASYKLPSLSSLEDALADEDENNDISNELDVQNDYFRKQSVIMRRGSLPASHPTVITTDYIRPDWETTLKNARQRLEKRAAAATAIHVSNMLIQEDHENILEQQMIEEAMRLSLLDQETQRNRSGSS